MCREVLEELEYAFAMHPDRIHGRMLAWSFPRDVRLVFPGVCREKCSFKISNFELLSLCMKPSLFFSVATTVNSKTVDLSFGLDV